MGWILPRDIKGGRRTNRVEWFVLGLIVGLIIAAVIMLPVALERNKYRDITTEQDATIRRYEAITAGYEELTAELFEMLEGEEK